MQISDKMVIDALKAFDMTAIHMHRDWRRRDAMRAALEAAINNKMPEKRAPNVDFIDADMGEAE